MDSSLSLPNLVSPRLVSCCLHCGGDLSVGMSNFCCVACKKLHQRFEKESISIDPALAFLDQENFQRQYLHPHSDYQYHLYVEGLHCSSCVHLLEKIPEYDESVSEARVDFGRSRLLLKTTDNFSLAALASLLKSWGYNPYYLNPQESNSDQMVQENRRLLKRIAVAGACTGNIMLFVIPIYAGLAGTWAQIFNWLGLILFLPILFYSAQSFYQGTWNSLRFQVINVDLPITVALWSGFILSTVNLIRGNGAVYYDSTASFLFLILCARYLLKRVQQNFLAPIRVQDFFNTIQFFKKTTQGWGTVPLAEVLAGDILRIDAGQIIPVDGVQLSQEALLDLSLLSGESMPRYMSQGMEILAGSKNLRPNLEMRVANRPSETKLAELLQGLEESSLKKVNFVNLTDRLAQRLTVIIFAVAVIFFIFYFPINMQEAFNRSLALIVLACPCALAFGSPLAMGLALRRAQKNGILIKDANSFEKILKIKNIFFDKTGTLTEARLKLVNSTPAELDERIKSIFLSLEQKSYHPIAFALREQWHGLPIFTIENLEEKLGQGVRGRLEGHEYEIRTLSDSLHEATLALVLLCDSQVVSRLYFEDPVREGAASCIQQLKSLGINCFLLSGDRRDRVQEAARVCGIKKEQAFAEMFPEDKQSIIEKYKNTCMIGDGANDSLSLKTADVGIAVKGSVQLSLQAADVYFLRGGLEPLLELWKLAKRSQSVLVRNLALSLLYNVVGGTLALTGFINPMMAAILMPISSALIVLSTLWGIR